MQSETQKISGGCIAVRPKNNRTGTQSRKYISQVSRNYITIIPTNNNSGGCAEKLSPTDVTNSKVGQSK